MVQHLYPNFLTEEREYKLSEKFWRNLWKEVVKEAGAAKEWKSPWLGAPLRDGDPIFSAVSQAQGRAVHVVQHAPTSGSVEIVWWQDKFGEEGVDQVIDQLVISCALSQETASRARALVWSWVTRGVVEKAAKEKNSHLRPDFSQLADEFIAKVGAANITPTTEVNLVYYCMDQGGNPIPPFRMSITPATTVKGAGNQALANSFALMFHVDAIIGNINSLVRPATVERFFVPRDYPHIPMRLGRLEIEIADIDQNKESGRKEESEFDFPSYPYSPRQVAVS
jgi:hypothetical protein